MLEGGTVAEPLRSKRGEQQSRHKNLSHPGLFGIILSSKPTHRRIGLHLFAERVHNVCCVKIEPNNEWASRTVLSVRAGLPRRARRKQHRHAPSRTGPDQRRPVSDNGGLTNSLRYSRQRVLHGRQKVSRIEMIQQ